MAAKIFIQANQIIWKIYLFLPLQTKIHYCPAGTKPVFAEYYSYTDFTMKISSELDQTDIRILAMLQENSRLTTKELAAAIHLSPTPTFERVKRLEREGYIKKYIAVLDAEKINCGFMAFCYLKMKQHTHENAMRIMNSVKDIPEIAECYNISGDYDFQLKIYTSDMKSYQNFLLRILGDLDCIGSLKSSFVLGEVKNTYHLPLPADN